jgi:hypothetical protein
MKWLIRYSRERNGRSMAEKLANEIVSAAKGEGAKSKRKKTHIEWKLTRLLRISEYNEEIHLNKSPRFFLGTFLLNNDFTEKVFLPS